MFCPHCGAGLAAEAAFCPHCGTRLAPAPAAPSAPASVDDFRTLNIMLTGLSIFSCAGLIGAVFCGLGIAFGTQARNTLAAGNVAEAQNKAKSARKMFFLGVFMMISAIILVVLALILYCFIIYSVYQGH